MLKQVHVISENDLDRVKKIGRRIRACCPVHHSRDRDLSIAPYFVNMDEEDERLAGWGYCHSINCGATVLVKEWNPRAASWYLGKPVTPVTPRITVLADGMRQAEEWQVKQLAALKKIHDTAISQLAHPRARAYLEQRGVVHTLGTLLALKVGYIPPDSDWRAPVPDILGQWCDRFLFPFTTCDGDTGFIGRALQLWTPGMDEREHKRLIEDYDDRMEVEHGDHAARYQIRRWRKTYKSGLFNASARERYQHLVLCEGPFDAIPLIHEGLENVVALAGAYVDPADYPKKVYSVTLALDADIEESSQKYQAIREALGYAGIAYELKKPPHDGQGKDWSERYRCQGRAGLALLLDNETGQAGALERNDQDVPAPGLDDAINQLAEMAETEELDTCAGCGLPLDAPDPDKDFFYTDDGILFCSPACRERDQARRAHIAALDELFNLPEETGAAPAPAPETHELSMQEIAARFSGAIPSPHVAIEPTAQAYTRQQWQIEAMERDAQKRALARAKLARPKSLEWSYNQLRKRDIDAENRAYEDSITEDDDHDHIEPGAGGNDLARLEARYRENTPASVFWRLSVNGWTPESISAKECIRRLTIMLASDDAKMRYAANQDIESRLYVGGRRWA